MQLTVEGYQADAGDAHPGAWPVRNVVSPGYFATMGVPFLHGRDFSPYDGPQSPKIAIVNEQFRRKYFGNRNPLGYRIGWNGKADTEIIGVVKDVKYEDLRKDAKPYWYIPYSQVESSRWQMMTVHARIAGDPAPVVSAIRNEIRTLDQNLPVFQVTTLETELGFHLSRERLITALGLFFAALAALLAGVGIFGLAAQIVTRRTKEIGIRMALGAKAAQVVGGIVNEVLVVVGVGIVLGTPLLFLWSSLLQTFVYGVAATDLAVLGAAICMILIVGLVGTYAPARLAANVDPVSTLRHE
jgi:predicted permease